MREYELTYLVSDEVLESDLNEITGKVSAIISDAEGKIKKEEIWGRRKLAYPIKKQDFANFVTLWLELPADQIANINHELQVFSQVLRHLMIIKTGGSEKLVVTKDDVIADNELKSIIGNKSTEVVEGETEGSYDLMAKRDSEKEEDEIDTAKIPEAKKEIKSEKTTEEVKPEKKKPKVKVVEKIDSSQEEKTETVEDEKKDVKVKKPVKVSKEDEADRIKKLDDKLDELLGDDL